MGASIESALSGASDRYTAVGLVNMVDGDDDLIRILTRDDGFGHVVRIRLNNVPTHIHLYCTLVYVRVIAKHSI